MSEVRSIRNKEQYLSDLATRRARKTWDQATEELRAFIESTLVEIQDWRGALASQTEMTPLVRKQTRLRQAAEQRLATRYPDELAEIMAGLEA